MRAWNKLYQLVYASVEGVSALLAKEIQTLCSIPTDGSEDGSNFDGPRAWNIVTTALLSLERTKTDKKYYRTAEELQLRHHLPDGCSAEEYSKKATAFVDKIMPNLAQKYDPEDAGDYIIDLMPKSLRESGRRIREGLVRTGKLTDHVYVVRVCRTMVAEEQASAKIQPTMVATSEIDTFGMLALSDTTGMALAGAGSGDLGLLSTPDNQGGDGGIKWCKGCPHPKGKCFLAPDFAGPLPVHIHVNDARRKGIEAAKKAYATQHNVPLVRLKAPSKDAITRWQAKDKDKKQGTKPPVSGQVGIDSDTLDSFMSGLMDVTDDITMGNVLITPSVFGLHRVAPAPPAVSEELADLNLEPSFRHYPTPDGWTYELWCIRLNGAASTVQRAYRLYRAHASSGATIVLPACCVGCVSPSALSSSPEIVDGPDGVNDVSGDSVTCEPSE